MCAGASKRSPDPIHESYSIRTPGLGIEIPGSATAGLCTKDEDFFFIKLNFLNYINHNDFIQLQTI